MRGSISAVVAVSMNSAAAFAQTPPSGEVRQSSIGYPSVTAALESMRSKSGVNVSTQSGWTIIEDRANLTIWSFTPAGHPAYPAAIRRVITEEDGAFFVQMNALCEATKSACDKLVAEFQELNNRMREDLERRRRSGAPSK